MLILRFLLTLFSISFAHHLMAEEIHHERAFTEHSVYFPDTTKITAIFTLTQQVDTCNSYLLQGQISNVPDTTMNYYVADFFLFGTMMYCDERTTMERTYTLEKEFNSSSLTILVPANIQVTFRGSGT